jgi:hypothetical protein
MTEQLTAAQARELAGPTVEERVDAVLALVRAAAEKQKRRVDLHDTFWVNGGYGSDRSGHREKQYDEAKKMLEKLGYKVWFYYSEGSQFVDMYTVVEW